MTQLDTRLVTAGRNHSGFGSVNPPVYHASTILFDGFDAFRDAYYGRVSPGYGRQGNPTTQALESALSEVLGVDHTLICASGLLAITIPMLAILEQGDHVLMADCVYGPSRSFCDHILSKMGIDTTYYAPDSSGEEVEALITERTKLIFMEAPGSMTFEMQDIRGICRVAKNHGCVTMLDYTWATPLFIKPFDLGVDIAIQAVTKYVAGHSDLVMGAVSATSDYAAKINKTSAMLGNYVSGDDASQALRGMRTMKVRLERQYSNAHKVIDWLTTQQAVAQILYPPLENHPGHAIWKRDMSGASALFTVILDASITTDQARNLCDALHHFGMGFSWGGYESLTLPFKPKEVRTASGARWDDDPWALRLHIGLEDPDDLIADLAQAFALL